MTDEKYLYLLSIPNFASSGRFACCGNEGIPAL
jgi:hypothetical protein